MLSSRLSTTLAVCALFGSMSALPTSAQILYSSYPQSGHSSYEITGDGGDQGEHEVAMQFRPTQSGLAAGAQLALYYDTSVVSPGAPYTGGPITVKIYSDSSGTPNSVLATGTISAVATNGTTGNYLANFITPVSLTSGVDYWLGADGGVGTSTTVFWAQGNGVTTNNAQRFDGAFNTGFSVNSGTAAAFTINGAAAATPEPGSLALLAGCGIAGVGLISRRKLRKIRHFHRP